MDSWSLNHVHVPVVSDGLEQLVLEEIVRRVRLNTPPNVLDMPCGDGRRAVEMAKLGARVLAADGPDQEGSVRGRALAAAVAGNVDFLARKTDCDPQEPLPEGSFDLVFCHHGIHRLPYAKARELLRGLLKSLNIGGKLFVSAYGLHSALGEAYGDAEKPVTERYCRLAAELSRCYGVTGPICLYSERNLVNLLIEIGSGVLRTFSSTHGVVKGVAVRI